MTPQETIEQAAQKYMERKAFEESIKQFPQPKETIIERGRHFEAGADYVLKHPELMRDTVVKYVKWREEFIASRGRIARSEGELFSKYIDATKQQGGKA
jgi:hypothetical protein